MASTQLPTDGHNFVGQRRMQQTRRRTLPWQEAPCSLPHANDGPELEEQSQSWKAEVREAPPVGKQGNREHATVGPPVGSCGRNGAKRTPQKTKFETKHTAEGEWSGLAD